MDFVAHLPKAQAKCKKDAGLRTNRYEGPIANRLRGNLTMHFPTKILKCLLKGCRFSYSIVP